MKSLLVYIALAAPLLSLSQNESTKVATSIHTEVNGRGNIIYCSSLELLWKEFTEFLGETPTPEELHREIYDLNKTAFDNEAPLEEEYWFAHIGVVGEGIIDSITNSYQNQFGKLWMPREYDANNLIGHSYLKKNVDFYSRLDEDFDDFKFKDSIHVKCFGLDGGWANPTYKRQLKIHDYKDEDNFIFQMGCKDSLDEVFFAKVPLDGNLFETYKSVIERVNKDSIRYIGNFDELQIPYLKFDITKNLENLKGVKIINSNYNQLSFEELSQRISFDLNKDGIRIESVGDLTMEFGISEIEPIIYAFNQPFLIIMKRKGKQMPYFLYWVQNSDHMEVID